MERPIVTPLEQEPLESPYDIREKEWPPVDSVTASEDEVPEGLQNLRNGDGSATFYLPQGSKGVTLPGASGSAQSGCSLEPLYLDSITLIKLPDGRELIRRGHPGNPLEERPHLEALSEYMGELMNFRGANNGYRPALQMWNPADYRDP